MGHSLAVLTMVAKQPRRVLQQLTSLRPQTDEIVVSAHDADWLDLFAAVADERLLIDPAPKGRHLGWLLGRCHADWILVVDDDEVLSPALAAELPELVADPDITHAFLPRRWAHPDARHWITTRPWGGDLQCQLLRNVPALWRFPGRTHEPIAVAGRATIARNPLYHLALLDQDYDARAEKYARYEASNPGRWSDGIPVNLHGLPEDVPGLRLAPVPDDDADAITSFQLGAEPDADAAPRGAVTARSLADEDRHAESRPGRAGFHDAIAVQALAPPERLGAGTVVAMDVLISNRSDERLTDAIDGSAVALAYHWLDADAGVATWDGDRTPLWAPVAPGRERRQRIAITAPAAAGRYLLQVAAVHEGRQWFGESDPHPVEIEPASAGVSVDGPLGDLHIWTEHLPPTKRTDR